MRFMKFLALAASALCAGSLQAQTSANYGGYILATGQHMTDIHFAVSGNSPTTGVASIARGPYTGKFSPIGYTLGGYYDFLSLGRFRMGVDARFISTSSRKSATADRGAYPSGVDYSTIGPEGRIYSGLAGVRFSTPVKLSSLRLVPYIGVNAGIVRTNYGILFPGSTQAPGTGRLSNLGLNGNAGVDIKLAPVVALRLDGSSGIVHGGPVNASYPLQTFSIGINFHSNR